MDHESLGKYSVSKKHPKKKKKTIWIFLMFLVLLIAIIYPLLSGVSLTGLSIFSDNSSNNSSEDSPSDERILVYTDLGVPTLELKDEFNEVKIKGSSLGALNVGTQEISLSNNFNSEIILTNFKGKLSFDENVLYLIEGKAEKVLLNGIPIESQSERNLKIELKEPFYYTFLSISDVSIPKLSYQTSGLVNLDNGKTIVNLDNESILIKDLEGSLSIEKNKLKFVGTLSYFETKGRQSIVIG